MIALAGSTRHAERREHALASAAALRPKGLRWALASEFLASAVGFVVMVQLARRLGPAGFARVEYASAVAAWLLVVVRGGIDVISYREAARRPRLIGPLTDILIGLRCAAAVVGYGLILAVAAAVGPERGAAVAVAGLLLVPSAFVCDVGLRALGRLRTLALAQGLRTTGYAACALSLVWGPTDALVAAWCLVVAELFGAVVPLVWHIRWYGVPVPRFRRRAWRVLAHRGGIAALTRFGRVSLYGADLLVLGWWAGPELGSYAAARRLVYGLVGLGLVVPASAAPAIARRWAAGARLARTLIEESLGRIWIASIPAALALMLSAGLWMPLLFGENYRQGAPWLIVIAARLPWVLTASFIQAALVSCRREAWVLDQMIGLVALAVVLVPISAFWAGPWGVGITGLAIEVVATIGGWQMLARLGLTPRWRFWWRLRGGEDR
jgi:O-antigen/teichoic acid export membrane protein